jgi:hypothetical protein
LVFIGQSEFSIMSNDGINARRQFLQRAVEAIALLACTPPVFSGSAAAQPGESAMSHPLVPFSTVVDSWDHHWFLWLPHHPHYESVEVASREADRDGSVAVWVWFTERAGSKRQIHYRNDARLAEFVGGNYRPIACQISGDDGRPRSVHVRFDDIENVPVDIDVRFDPDQTLTRHGAGLTDQSGHMSDRAFLVFHRETNALAREGRALIGPTNYTFGSEDSQGAFAFKWAYSHRIFIGLIRYNSFTAMFGPGGFTSSAETAGLYVLQRAWGGSVSLLSDQTGQLREYVDRGANGDFLRVVFDPPLPTCGRDDKPQSSSFSISIRAAADLVRGSVDTRCGDHVQVLDWHPSQPIWASRQPFRSEISRPDERSLSVAVTPAV